MVATIHAIQGYVSIATGVGLHEMLSPRRDGRVVAARHAAMWLAYKEGVYSFPQIGWAFGDRHHTTVMHARRRIDERMAADPAFANRMHLLSIAIDGRATERDWLILMTGMGRHAARSMISSEAAPRQATAR
jgi:chromosomal replication initiator protein